MRLPVLAAAMTPPTAVPCRPVSRIGLKEQKPPLQFREATPELGWSFPANALWLGSTPESMIPTVTPAPV